ncbi:MAG: hypothetical protein AAF355_07295, partial [Myxococcota bacterium]
LPPMLVAQRTLSTLVLLGPARIDGFERLAPRKHRSAGVVWLLQAPSMGGKQAFRPSEACWGGRLLFGPT